VKELGFSSYEAFATEALIAEFECRKSAESGTARAYQAIFSGIRAAAKRNDLLLQESRKLLTAQLAVSHLSVNMAITAERLGESGKTLNVIAETFGKWAGEADGALRAFSEKMEGVVGRLKNVSFQIAASRIQIAMFDFLIGEAKRGGGGANADLENFAQMANAIFMEVNAELFNLLSEMRGLATPIALLRDSMNALYIVRQSGRTEAARCDTNGDFGQHLDQTGAFVESVTEGIGEIETAAFEARSELERIEELLQGVVRDFNQLQRAFRPRDGSGGPPSAKNPDHASP
jgi:hypothetical protein